jgi:hypothetical protein
MLSGYLVLRFLKFVGVAVFFAGVVGTFRSADREQHRRWAEGHAAPGYVLTWVMGLGLASLTGAKLAQPWIVLGALLGTTSVLATLAQAHLAGSKSKPLSAVASLAFIASLAAMVWKPS